MKSNKLKREPKYIAKFKAFPYQQEAVDAVKDLEYAAIFHEQGLGKTKIAIDVLLYWLSECSMDTALIVTKKQLVANWVNEFKDHTSIKPAVLNTDKNNNYRIFCGPYRVVLTNFETLETEKQQFELYLKVRNVGIIIDESAKLKNPNSKLTKTYFELAPLFQRRIIMTGTPVANRPYDIWAQIYFLDFGESLGADFNEFKKETDLSNKLSRNTDLQEEFEDNISQIFNRISSFTVRETKNSGIITLPDKVYIQEVTEFNRMQEELYERIRTELYAEVVRDGERYIDDSSAIVKRLLRLIQVTSNPKLVDEECEASAKEPLLDELIQKILANGEKCIVWSNFIENIDYFTKKYQDLGAVKIHGKMNMDARNRSVQKFHDDDIRILFATPASAKEGLTLTLGYCQKLKFLTSIHGEEKASCIIYDAEKLKYLLSPQVDSRDSIDQVLSSVLTIEEIPERINKHYFSVELYGVVPESDLLNDSEVVPYLQQNLPVPFSRDFVWGSMIKQKLVQMEVELAEYNVELRTDRTVIDICKPYKNKILADRIRKINDSISDINFVPFYSGEKVTAMLWYAETNFLGTVLDKDIKGIRIRQGNILIGDENTLRKCYKEERFNSWMVGELLVFNEDIIPNTRRDDYEKNSAYKELLSQFTEWANEMSRQIRHRSYERSLTQSDKKFLSDESVTDVDGVDISLGTELDSYDMDDSDSVANTDLLSKLSLLMDMGKKKTKYNVLNLNSKFTVDQKQTLEHVFDALYAKYTNAKANDIIQTIIDSF